MSFSKACCKLPPVVSDYVPVGNIEHLGDLPVYTVGPNVSIELKKEKALK